MIDSKVVQHLVVHDGDGVAVVVVVVRHGRRLELVAQRIRRRGDDGAVLRSVALHILMHALAQILGEKPARLHPLCCCAAELALE